MDVAIISLHSEPTIYNTMLRLLPSASVYVQAGVDVRKASLDNLAEADIINETGYTTLSEGRKWHWELNSKGGIGLAHANRIALLKNPKNHMLLLEDDCVIRSSDKFLEEITLLSQHASDFDMAVFGAYIVTGSSQPTKKVEYMPDGWYYLDGAQFILLHCVFYSKEGRIKVGNILKEGPLSMQLDGLYSTLARRRKITIIVQLQNVTASQSLHLSSIQNDVCTLCDVQPHAAYVKYIHIISWYPLVFLSIVFSIVAVCLYSRGRRGCMLHKDSHSTRL